MMFDLPTSVEVNGVSYQIRSDYRAVLDIIIALSDPDLSDQEKSFVALDIFFEDFPSMPDADYDLALRSCMRFINCGNERKETQKTPKIMDWEQDFPYIAAPVNRVLRMEIRSVPYLHWWTFISAYQEIGDCLFAQIVGIRNKKAKGKPLAKHEKEFYKHNRDLVDIKVRYTETENDILKMWTGSKK